MKYDEILKSCFSKFFYSFKITTIGFLIKWLFIASIVGIVAGSASALFLVVLEWATLTRENNTWLIALLPLAGLFSGFLYHYFGRDVEAGNNLLIEQFHNPDKIIPFKMAPLVFLGTIITHLFGGSAGREGTAVQMGGSIANQLNFVLKLRPSQRSLLLVCGISAGFASIFGTPMAAAVFGLEVFFIGSLNYRAIFPSFMSALVANYTCNLWNAHHTHYSIIAIPPISGSGIVYSVISGIVFGLTALVFSNLTSVIGQFSKKKITYPPLRPLIGGTIIALVVVLSGSTKYLGLGIPTILASFQEHLPPYDFLLKIIFTSVTIGFAFKGGEVTPLFFMGATLGNALSRFIPLPTDLLAGMGFVAVFSGAANTPLTTIFMAIELFGKEIGVYASITCVVAYLFSGHTGIYTSQKIATAKIKFYQHLVFILQQRQKIKSTRNTKTNTKKEISNL